MTKGEIKEIMKKLLKEIEEEDIGISLFSTFCESQEELAFFKEEDREWVVRILKRLSEDSKRHKAMLESLIDSLGGKLHAI